MDPESIAWRIAHELGHVAALRGGCSQPHLEASVDRIAMAVALPRRAVRSALARGFDPVRILAALPGLPATWVLLRAAWVARRSVIVRIGSERWAYSPDGAAPPRAGAWERSLVAGALAAGYPQRDLFDVVAWPVGFTDRAAVVIVFGG